jgi:hypothetical protein
MGDIIVLQEGQWTIRPTQPGGIQSGRGGGGRAGAEGGSTAGPGGADTGVVEVGGADASGAAGGPGGAVSGRRTTAPHFGQNRAPDSARVPQRGQPTAPAVGAVPLTVGRTALGAISPAPRRTAPRR